MDSPLKRIAAIVAALAFLGLAAWGVSWWLAQKPCPRPLAVHLAAMTGKQRKASDRPVRAAYGHQVMLVAVIEAEDPATGGRFYVSSVDDVEIGGKKIPPEKIHSSWPLGCGILQCMWYTVEKDASTGEYRNRLRPLGGYELTQVADVRPRDAVDLNPRLPNAGSQMFRVRAQWHHSKTGQLVKALSSPGADELNAGAGPETLLRVTIGEE
jgi:hypothetical protein